MVGRHFAIPEAMTRETEVKNWWNALSADGRLDAAHAAGLTYNRLNPSIDWKLPWDLLMPFSQQRALHRYYHGGLTAQLKPR
jgi:hypothetical protein